MHCRKQLKGKTVKPRPDKIVMSAQDILVPHEDESYELFLVEDEDAATAAMEQEQQPAEEEATVEEENVLMVQSYEPRKGAMKTTMQINRQSVEVVIDTGADVDVMSWSQATELGINVDETILSTPIRGVNGWSNPVKTSELTPIELTGLTKTETRFRLMSSCFDERIGCWDRCRLGCWVGFRGSLTTRPAQQSKSDQGTNSGGGDCGRSRMLTGGRSLGAICMLQMLVKRVLSMLMEKDGQRTTRRARTSTAIVCRTVANFFLALTRTGGIGLIDRAYSASNKPRTTLHEKVSDGRGSSSSSGSGG